MSFYKAINYWVLGGFEGKKNAYDAIADAKSMGLDGIELTVGDCISFDISKDECEKISAAAKKAGVGLRTLASGFFWGCSLSSPDAAERAKAVEAAKKYIQIAAWLGAETVLLISGAVHVAWDDSRPVVSYQQVWDLSVDSLKKIIPLAEKLNVNIALENVWNKFLLSPMEMKFYIDQFNSDKIGAYFDIANVSIVGFPEHWIEILGPRIKAVHIKNFSRSDFGGGLHGFGDNILEGDIDLNSVKAAIKAKIPNVPVTAEMIPFCRLPDLVLPDMELAKETAKRLLSVFG